MRHDFSFRYTRAHVHRLWHLVPEVVVGLDAILQTKSLYKRTRLVFCIDTLHYPILFYIDTVPFRYLNPNPCVLVCDEKTRRHILMGSSGDW